MAACIDNLRNLNLKTIIDKDYVEDIFTKAISRLNKEITVPIELLHQESWRVKRNYRDKVVNTVKNKNGYVKPADDHPVLDIYISTLVTGESGIPYDGGFTVKYFEKTFPVQTYYGLKQDFEEFPDILLDKNTFKQNYDQNKVTIKLPNYQIMYNCSSMQKQVEASINYQNLNFYLETILNNYVAIFKENNVPYEIQNKNSDQNNPELLTPDLWKIFIKDSKGNDFISIEFNIKKEMRLINNQFYYDYKIETWFFRHTIEKNEYFNINNQNQGSAFFNRRDKIKYNNTFQLKFLDNYIKPNYYLFVMTPRGMIKLNRNIINEGIKQMFLHYIMSPILKEANIDCSIQDMSENLGNYLLMYEMMKY